MLAMNEALLLGSLRQSELTQEAERLNAQLRAEIIERKQAEQQMKRALDFGRAVLESVPPLLILSHDLRVQKANESFYQTFRVTPAQTENRLVFELGNGQWNIPALHALLEDILPRSQTVKNYEVTHEFQKRWPAHHAGQRLPGRRTSNHRLVDWGHHRTQAGATDPG